LDVDSSGALVDSSGTPSPFLYAIGPVRKGSLWESIAVPELRAQASQLAKHLVSTLLPHARKINRGAPETAGLELASIATTAEVTNERAPRSRLESELPGVAAKNTGCRKDYTATPSVP
jgi:hypothetical protein